MTYVVVGTLVADGFDRDPGIGTLLRDATRRLLPPVYLQLFEPPVMPLDTAATLLFEWIGVIVWVAFCVLLWRSFLVPPAGSTSATSSGCENSCTTRAADRCRG
ncbi:hypothetical protein [Rhodococcus pyridinivorans]|uniref:hypothetical protein n=1 Tax=Rhodococcus pyridinivorans TaxID=103816 RepID=UPI00147930D7|nr:hypothetical protein [Rhodococcus pyridinivorans]MCD2140563.1 hypothetical protein [Rhodococcus pyridinivorans]